MIQFMIIKTIAISIFWSHMWEANSNENRWRDLKICSTRDNLHYYLSWKSLAVAAESNAARGRRFRCRWCRALFRRWILGDWSDVRRSIKEIWLRLGLRRWKGLIAGGRKDNKNSSSNAVYIAFDNNYQSYHKLYAYVFDGSVD